MHIEVRLAESEAEVGLANTEVEISGFPSSLACKATGVACTTA
jgi:hypothetical protein